jgi:hypothetical protein
MQLFQTAEAADVLAAAAAAAAPSSVAA